MKKSAPNRQRGSIMVPVVVSLLVGLILLGGVQLGYYFHLKRELQNTADLAALSGVQLLSEGGNVCGDDDGHPAKIAAIANIKENFKQNDAVKADGSPGKLKWTVSCGTWDPAKEKADQDDPTNPEKGEYRSPQYFEAELNSNNKFNALRVVLSYEPPIFIPTFSSFFGGSSSNESSATTISVEAIAKSNEPVAAFQIGSQLLRFDKDTPLGGLLSLVGLDINSLTLLDSEGLVGATIKPSGLLGLLGGVGIDELGLLTPNGVANLDNVTVLQLINASVQLVEEDSTAVAELGVLSQELADIKLGEIKLLDMAIPLGGGEGQPGLLAFLGIGGNDPLGGALDVKLGVGDLLKTAIAVAANGHALEVPELKILGLVQARLSIVEPPVIAIGPVGTTGHSAQIRLWLDIDTERLLEDSLLIGPLVKILIKDILGIRVHLPVAIDVVSGTGTLEKLECSRTPKTMDISVRSRGLNVCVGGMDAASIMSDKRACEVGLQDTELIKLLHIPFPPTSLHIAPLEYTELVENLEVGDIEATPPNPLKLGETVENLVTELLDVLSDLLRPPASTDGGAGTDSTNQELIYDLLDSYLEASKVNGFYNIDNVTNLVLYGSGDPSTNDYMPPLLKGDFTFNNAIPTSCVVAVCPVSTWEPGTFSQAFKAYATPGGLLDVLGISTLGNGYVNCGGLLSALLAWNACVKNNLTQLFTKHPNQIAVIEPNSSEIQSILDKTTNEVTCNGALCVLLKPVLNLLKPILNGVGSLLTALLDGVLGLELGRTDVTALAIGCDPAQLVY